MQISEMTFTIDRHGSMKIPSAVLKEMGLFPGDHVRVAYLTQDGNTNTFREFMLSSDAIDECFPGENNAIQIPARLMREANISPDSDLQIVCLNGSLVICQDTGFRPGELYSILENLQTAESLAAMLPNEAQQSLSQLEQALQTFREITEVNG